MMQMLRIDMNSSHKKMQIGGFEWFLSPLWCENKNTRSMHLFFKYTTRTLYGMRWRFIGQDGRNLNTSTRQTCMIDWF
jgi:hypothetical protein